MRRKFVIGHSFRQSQDWIRQYHLGFSKQYEVLTDINRLRGIAAENMEFVLLDGHWFSGVFQNDNDYYFYRSLLSLGAIKTRVYQY